MSGVNDGKFQSISDRLKFGRPFYIFIKWSLRMLLFGWNCKTMYYTAFAINHSIGLRIRFITYYLLISV